MKLQTTYQSHIYESNDLKFGLGDVHVTRFSNPAKFGEDRVNGGAPTWWSRAICNYYYYYFCFICLDTHTVYTRELILTHNSSKDVD